MSSAWRSFSRTQRLSQLRDLHRRRTDSSSSYLFQFFFIADLINSFIRLNLALSVRFGFQSQTWSLRLAPKCTGKSLLLKNYSVDYYLVTLITINQWIFSIFKKVILPISRNFWNDNLCFNQYRSIFSPKLPSDIMNTKSFSWVSMHKWIVWWTILFYWTIK